MHKAGVRFLAGTDVTNPYCFPGFGLHDELALLVSEAKFTPLEALRCATSNPAIFLGQEKDLGTVEKGKLADLVVLDRDPFAVPATELSSVQVRATFVDGSRVHGAC